MATKNKGRQGTLSTLGEAMVKHIIPSQSPSVIRIEVNGVFAKLCKVIDPETGKMRYTGIPETVEGGHRCKFGLSIDMDGYFDGSAALNFITNGGWKRGAKKPTYAQKAAIRKEFVDNTLSCIIQLRGDEAHGIEALKNEIRTISGCEVEQGTMDEKELRTVSLMDLPYYIIDLAKSAGLKLVVDVPRFIANMVQPTYAKCVSGQWDSESGQVATTSALKASHARLMQECGFKFEKVRTFSVKAAAPKETDK